MNAGIFSGGSTYPMPSSTLGILTVTPKVHRALSSRIPVASLLEEDEVPTTATTYSLVSQQAWLYNLWGQGQNKNTGTLLKFMKDLGRKKWHR